MKARPTAAGSVVQIDLCSHPTNTAPAASADNQGLFQDFCLCRHLSLIWAAFSFLSLERLPGTDHRTLCEICPVGVLTGTLSICVHFTDAQCHRRNLRKRIGCFKHYKFQMPYYSLGEVVGQPWSFLSLLSQITTNLRGLKPQISLLERWRPEVYREAFKASRAVFLVEISEEHTCLPFPVSFACGPAPLLSFLRQALPHFPQDFSEPVRQSRKMVLSLDP